jgi:hypothetical protein
VCQRLCKERLNKEGFVEGVEHMLNRPQHPIP